MTSCECRCGRCSCRPAFTYPIIHIDPRYYRPTPWPWPPGTVTCGSVQADTNSVAWNG